MFKNAVKKYLVEGQDVAIHFNGLSYEGTVIEVDFSNVNDYHVTIQQPEGTLVIIPVGTSTAIVVTPIDVDETAEDEAVAEAETAKAKAAKKKQQGR